MDYPKMVLQIWIVYVDNVKSDQFVNFNWNWLL